MNSKKSDKFRRASTSSKPLNTPAGDLPVQPAGLHIPAAEQAVVIECAWCKMSMGSKYMVPPAGMEGFPTSTICPKCLRLHFPDIVENYRTQLRAKVEHTHEKVVSFGAHVAGHATYQSMKVLQALNHEWAEAKDELKKFEEA
jgi:hypothetical protein